MSIYYSPSLRGFFDSRFPPEPPEDGVEVTVEAWEALLQGQRDDNMQIEPDASGYPVLVPQGESPPTPIEAVDYSTLTPGQVAQLRARLGLPE